MPRSSITLSAVLLSSIGLPPLEARAQGGSAVVRVVVQSPATATSFEFTGTPSGSVTAGGSLAASSLSPGSYTTTQAAAGAQSQLVGILCDDGGSAASSIGDVASRSATYHIDAGETVTCTFTYAALESPERSDSEADAGTNPFWQLVTDEWIIGYLTSTVNASGMSCNMFRTYELQYVGG